MKAIYKLSDEDVTPEKSPITIVVHNLFVNSIVP